MKASDLVSGSPRLTSAQWAGAQQDSHGSAPAGSEFVGGALSQS